MSITTRIENALQSKWAGVAGTAVFVLGVIKPFLSLVQWGLDVISEGQTVATIWPAIVAGAVWLYRGMPFWLNPILMIVGIALLIGSRSKTVTIDAPSAPRAPFKSPVTESIAVRPSIPLVAVEAPLPAIPRPVELTDSDKPEQAGILFAQDSKMGLIWLKFLPDTAQVNTDALLLIVFACKLIKNENEVSLRDAKMALDKSGCTNAQPRGIAAVLWMTSYDPSIDINQVGRACVERGLLYKGGLARGGMFTLTESGARHALHLAKDMIQRA